MTFTHNPQKAHTSSVRAKSATSPTRIVATVSAPQRRVASSANSLFLKILPLSPYSGRFCGLARTPLACNLHEFNILAGRDQKYWRTTPGHRSSANSLFQKILPVSPYVGRFCEEECRPCLRNSNESKILAKTPSKFITVARPPRTRPTRPAPEPPLDLLSAAPPQSPASSGSRSTAAAGLPGSCPGGLD